MNRRQMYAVTPLQLRRIAGKCMTWREDVHVERIYGHRPKALCLPHLITFQYYSLLRFFVLKLAMTSDSLQLWPEIIDNIIIS